MPFVYNKREFPDQAAKNAYLESLKPVKAWEDLGESFEPLPKADAPDAFCKVTLLYISELYSRKNWFCKGKDSILVMPDICALVERTYPDGTVKRALFDAGVRKGANFTTPIIKKMAEWFRIAAPFSATELLAEVNVKPEDIQGVYISHMHFDHCGDIGEFPKSTELGIGPNVPKDPESLAPLLDLPVESLQGRNLKIMETVRGKVGPFDILEDVFGDGTFLILASHGHTPHHTSGLIRVSAEGDGQYILMGGDTCHHASMLFPHPKTGETAPDNLTAEYHPERAPGCCCVNHEDLDSAYKVMSRTARLEREPNVLTILAHDGTIAPLMSHRLIHRFDPPKDFMRFKQRDMSGVHDDVE